MRSVHIYALHIDDGEIRYVGKTVNDPSVRLNQHRQDAKRGYLPVHHWFRENDFRISITILETIAPDQNWKERERYWISYCRNFAVNKFLNVLKGGEGSHNPTFSKEHREKISAALRTGHFKNCEECGKRFWVMLCREARGHGRFCSRVCKDKWHSTLPPVNIAFPPQAIEAARQYRLSITHCPQGHPYAGDNLIRRAGRRICRQCGRDASAKHKTKLKVDASVIGR